MNTTVKTKSGVTLPLISLKGKDYMMVAYRLLWLTEDVENYIIDTQILGDSTDHAMIRAKITILDKDGKLVKQATGTKTESKASFHDFVEKAETGAIGRALAMLGYGTQHALADLDEGSRIVDTPLKAVKDNSTKPLKNGSVSKQGDF